LFRRHFENDFHLEWQDSPLRSLKIVESQFQPSERLPLVWGEVGGAFPAEKIAATAMSRYGAIEIVVNNLRAGDESLPAGELATTLYPRSRGALVHARADA
jgi:hypothetical protein